MFLIRRNLVSCCLSFRTAVILLLKKKILRISLVSMFLGAKCKTECIYCVPSFPIARWAPRNAYPKFRGLKILNDHIRKDDRTRTPVFLRPLVADYGKYDLR